MLKYHDQQAYLYAKQLGYDCYADAFLDKK